MPKSRRAARRQPPVHAPPAPPRGRLTTELWIALALGLLTAAVYAPVRNYGFLSYDDIDYVVENPRVSAGFTREGVVAAWTSVHQATWHPLTTLSHMLDCQLFGMNAGAHHLGNVVLHVLSTLVLFAVLVRMTAQPWPSGVVAGLFALHPLHVESVAWIAERKDVLSTLFFMLTLWGYVAYVRRPGLGRYAALLAAYLAALLSKPMVVTLPFVLLLLDLWPLRRWSWGNAGAADAGGPSAPLPHRAAPRLLLLEKLPLFILAAALSAVTFIVQRGAGAVVPLALSPFADRVANAVLAYATYLRQTVWPAGLAVFYPFEAPLPGWKVAGAAVFLLAASIAVLRQARRRPYLLVGWLWYLGMLVPVIGLVRIGEYAMADRYTYVPLIGIFIMAAWGIPDLLQGIASRQTACAAAATAAVATCAGLTARQVQVWQDTSTLFAHALAVTPNNYLAHVNLGMALDERGQEAQAFEHVSEAVRLKPSYPVAQYALGLLLNKRGERAAAKEHFLAALRLDPTYSRAHNNLGVILAAEGDHAGAAARYREALRLSPHLFEAHDNLGIALETLGQADAAIAEYREGVRLAPQRAAAQVNLAEALGVAGRFPEAARHFRAALHLDPQLTRARLGLAVAFAKSGQVREAITEFDALLREQPTWPALQTMLAWLLATPDDPRLRDGPRALRLAEDAVRQTERQDPDALNSLAAAYAEVGRFAEAVDTAALALEIAQATGRTSLASALADRLERYRAGQPARDLMRGTQR